MCIQSGALDIITAHRHRKGFFMRRNTNLKKFLKSLKFRLILLIIFLAIVPGIIIRVGILSFYESRAVSIRKSEILSQARILTNQIAVSEYLENSRSYSGTIPSQIDLLTTIYDGRIIIVDQAYQIIYDTYNLDDRKTIISEEVVLSFSGSEMEHYDGENHYIELALPIKNPEDESNTVLGVMLISVSTDNIELNLVYLRQTALILETVTGVLILFCGTLVVIYLMKPFRKLSEDVEKVKGGYSGESLEVNNYTETRDLCDKINDMLGKIKVMDESRQEFVSNVSHELKTPMTSMKVLADSINSMPDAPKELYQEFMQDITNELERETKIINDLLSLVKMDKSGATLNIEIVNINELLEQILTRLQPLADKQQVELVMESFRPISAEVDEVKLSLAITNLVENAIKYNKTDGTGWVHVSLNADHQYFYLKVEDSGMGIPESSWEHIYERFYRVDKSHSGEIEGTGLGLAITRSSILMHRGAIKVYSVLGEGTTFDVRIPMNYIV